MLRNYNRQGLERKRKRVLWFDISRIYFNIIILSYLNTLRNGKSAPFENAKSTVNKKLVSARSVIRLPCNGQKINSIHKWNVPWDLVYVSMIDLDVYLWFFIDEHDKITDFQNNRFPFKIYEAINTASRTFIWIRALLTNRIPELVVWWYF